MRERNPGTGFDAGNHGAVQTGEPIDKYTSDRHNKNLAPKRSPRLKKDVVLRLACERVIVRYLLDEGIK